MFVYPLFSLLLMESLAISPTSRGLPQACLQGGADEKGGKSRLVDNSDFFLIYKRFICNIFPQQALQDGKK